MCSAFKEYKLYLPVCRAVLMFLLLHLHSCYREFSYNVDIHNDSIIYIGEKRIFVDTFENFALYPLAPEEIFGGVLNYGKNTEVLFNGVSQHNNAEIEIDNIDPSGSLMLEIFDSNNRYNKYSLKFTRVPVVQIEHRYEYIPNHQLIFCGFSLSELVAGGKTYNEYARIRTRGATSLAYPKKSLKVELIENANTRETKLISWLGMPPNDNWILDATYIDRSNMRNRVSFDVWSEIQNRSSKNGFNVMLSSSQGHFVEVFLNSRYHGLFCFNERVDNVSLELPGTGFLYKSREWSAATLYNDAVPDTAKSSHYWSGWEQKFPDTDNEIIWKPLFDFVEFVNKSSSSKFINEIESQFALDQAIDYFLFINLIQGEDNAGKNLFLAKRALDEPFYICPWDLDATWGRNWLAEPSLSQSLITFKLFDRLMDLNPEHFNKRLHERWFELRKDVLSYERLLSHFHNYEKQISGSGAIAREKHRWPGALDDIQGEIGYIESWTAQRLSILDEIFEKMQ